MWTGLLANLVMGQVKKAIRTAIGDARNQVLRLDPSEVVLAREVIKERIQDQRKIGGTLRRWACAEVDELDAADAGQLLEKLERLVA